MVPMKYVIEYLGLDLRHITDMANYELNLIDDKDRALNYASISR